MATGAKALRRSMSMNKAVSGSYLPSVQELQCENGWVVPPLRKV